MDLFKSLNADLQEDWEKLFKSVGVDSFEELSKGKKDLSKLIPVKKQITRGGKTVETTVYVSPKEAEDMKSGKKPEEKKKPQVKKKEESKKEKPKKEEKPKVAKKPKAEKKPKEKPKADVGIIAPHDDSALKALHSQLDSWKNKEVSEALKEASQSHYLVTATSNGKVVGIGAFKKKGNALHMEHFGSIKEVPGVGKQLINHLMEEASKRGLGVSVKPPKGSSKALQDMGLEDDYSGVLSLDSEGVKKALKGKGKEEPKKAPEKPKKAEKEPEKKESKEKPENKVKEEKKETPKKEEPKKKSPEEEKQAEHKKLTKELRSVRKQLGSDQYRALIEHHGITWEKTEHTGVNTMRATMAAAEFIKGGGKLSVKDFLKAKEEAEKKEAEVKKSHDLDQDHFETGFKELRGKERLVVAGQVKGTMKMKDSDRPLIEELGKVRSEKEFKELYIKAEDEEKLNEFTGPIFSIISDLYELKSNLFKVDGYRVALGRDKAEKLGENINSDTAELSKEELFQLQLYTGSASTMVNEYLRKGLASKEHNEGAINMIKALNPVLRRNELQEDVMLYRGAGYKAIGGQMAKDILSGDIDKYIGAEITDKGFMSTSLGATSMFKGDVTFQIMAPKGTKGRYIEKETSTMGEHEVLLPTGTKMTVKEIKVNKYNKIHILVEIPKQTSGEENPVKSVHPEIGKSEDINNLTDDHGYDATVMFNGKVYEGKKGESHSDLTQRVARDILKEKYDKTSKKVDFDDYFWDKLDTLKPTYGRKYKGKNGDSFYTIHSLQEDKDSKKMAKVTSKEFNKPVYIQDENDDNKHTRVH